MTPIWALLLAFFCPPLIYTNLIVFRSVPWLRAQSLTHSCSFLSALLLSHLVCLFPEKGHSFPSLEGMFWKMRVVVLPLRYLSMRFLYFLGHGSGGGQLPYLSALFVVN